MKMEKNFLFYNNRMIVIPCESKQKQKIVNLNHIMERNTSDEIQLLKSK